jgi:hypothetical protein
VGVYCPFKESTLLSRLLISERPDKLANLPTTIGGRLELVLCVPGFLRTGCFDFEVSIVAKLTVANRG